MHDCGQRCCEGAPTAGQEGETCRLTGFVVSGPPLLAYTRSSRDTFSKRQLLGDNFVRMGTKGTKRRRPRAVNIKGKIEQALRTFLYSEARIQEYETAQARVTTAARASRSNQHLDVFKVAFAASTRLRHSINPPPPRDAPEVEALAGALTRYFKVAGGLSSQKAVSVYCALMLQVLRDGLTIKNTVVVYPSPFVQKHSPSDMQLGKINPHVSCRAISTFFRRFKANVVTPTGDPIATKCLRLSY